MDIDPVVHLFNQEVRLTPETVIIAEQLRRVQLAETDRLLPLEITQTETRTTTIRMDREILITATELIHHKIQITRDKTTLDQIQPEVITTTVLANLPTLTEEVVQEVAPLQEALRPTLAEAEEHHLVEDNLLRQVFI